MSGLILITGSDGFILYLYKDLFKITTANSKYHRHLCSIVAIILYFHHSTPIEDNETFLTDLGFFVFRVGNIINRTNN